MAGDHLGAAALAATMLLAAVDAHAWVCSRVLDGELRETGPSLSWSHRDVSYSLTTEGTADIAGDGEAAVLAAAFQVWEDVSECSPPNRTTDVTFTRVPRRTDRDLIGFDFLDPANNENLLIFRDHDWPHSSRIIALTTTSYSAQSGQILDADIEFNSETFTFADLSPCCPNCDGSPANDPDPACSYTDLKNTAVHEIGHILGLAHPDDWQPIDPTCSLDSTMCATAELGDTDKRDLACDDRDAVVFKYPAASPSGTCQQPACALGLEACGSCAPAACAPWIDCGFCAPPDPLVNDVTVTAVGFDNGMEEGCGCAPAHASAAWAVALLFLARRRRRG